MSSLALSTVKLKRRHVAALFLLIGLPLAGTSVSGLAAFKAATPTLNAISIPPLARALGLPIPAPHVRPPTRPGPPNTPRAALPLTVNIALVPQEGAAAQDSLSVAASNIVAGTSFERLVTLRNVGSDSIQTVSVALSTPQPAPLVSSPGGLQVAVEQCSSPWQVTGPVAVCPGTASTALAPQPLSGLAGSTTPLSGAGPIAPGASVWLMMRFWLPLSATSSFASQSATAVWSFVATGA